MPTESEVYNRHSAEYEALIQREDYQNNLLRAVRQICPLKDKDVIDLGAGTGRLLRLIGPEARTIWAFDTSAHMLSAARKSMQPLQLTNWNTSVADHRFIPLAEGSADLVISGWSFCYLAVWGGETWRVQLDAGLAEAIRLLRLGGSIILLETLGTGCEKPNPPAHLADYFAWLAEKGFKRIWIRTDYRFSSVQEAFELSGFFFGEQMAAEVITKKWQILPECTGIWSLTK